MFAIYLALFAYFVNAVVFLVDKYLLDAPLPRPLAYAFWVAILSAFALFLIPFGVIFPDMSYLLVAGLCGMATFLGLVFLYESMMIGDVSVAATKVGALSAMSSYLFSMMILPSAHRDLNGIAFLFLVFGTLMLARASGRVVFRYALLSGICMGLSVVLLKWVFVHGDFVNGVFWSRMGFVGAAMLSLLSPEARSQIFKFVDRSSHHSQRVFLANKALAAGGFLLLYYAISLGAVDVINALIGFQFMFVLILALALRTYLPQLEKRITLRALTNKLIGIVCIIIGFLFTLFMP